MSSSADSAATMYRVVQFPQWMKTVKSNGLISPLLSSNSGYRRQQIKPMYLLDGAVVAIKRKVLMDTEGKRGVHVYMGKKTIGIIEDKKYATEVDVKEDLDLVKFYLGKGMS